MRGYNGSNTPERIRNLWRTPQPIYDNLDRKYHFVGDVAASADNHLHENYLTEQEDALTVDWSKRFGTGFKWCNPPYDNIGPWIEKAASESSTVMLVPSDTSVRWAKRAYDTASEIQLVCGRIAFTRADTGEPQGGNNKGSMIIVWNPLHEGPCNVTMIDRYELMTIH
ncbi:phage N-6-adenine-methyltransferase [Salmonella enterica subsp. enterica serovar Ibadan]|nr:phage N-6-adenine-methyltransferase [Salmonella enterica subsp. enterica serovar Ibadan]ECF3282133.1 phage N-6-adenine-methyltransferase [Salmonella enterica subsp. enterica serovar Ibadan]